MRRVVFGPAGKWLLLSALMLLLISAPLANAKPLSEGGFLGVYARELDIALLEALDFDGDGVLIEDVVQGSPADQIGIEPGDILTTFDGRTITSPRSLRRSLWRTDPGDKVEVELWRDGKARKETVELSEDSRGDESSMVWHFDDGDLETFMMKGGQFLKNLDSLSMNLEKPAYLGVEMQTLNDQLATYFGSGKNRAMVEAVKEETAAEEAGLEAGDVFLKIDGEEIMDTKDVTDALRKHKKGDKIEITVLRKGKKKTFSATLGERDFYWFGKGEHLYVGDALDEYKRQLGSNKSLHFVVPEDDGDMQIFRRNYAQ